MGTHPLTHGGAPAHNAALQPRVGSNPRPLEHGAAFYPHAVLHHHPGPDGDVGPDGAVHPDPCRRVLRVREMTFDIRGWSTCSVQEVPTRTHHENVAKETGASAQLLGRLLSQGLKVHAHPFQEVLGLPNIHPEPYGQTGRVCG